MCSKVFITFPKKMSSNDDLISREQNRQLVPFLRKLADSIERDALLPRQLREVGEFFMKYQFNLDRVEEGDASDDEDEFSKDEITRFLIMGWWIYRRILKNPSNASDTQSDGDLTNLPSPNQKHFDAFHK